MLVLQQAVRYLVRALRTGAGRAGRAPRDGSPANLLARPSRWPQSAAESPQSPKQSKKDKFDKALQSPCGAPAKPQTEEKGEQPERQKQSKTR